MFEEEGAKHIVDVIDTAQSDRDNLLLHLQNFAVHLFHLLLLMLIDLF